MTPADRPTPRTIRLRSGFFVSPLTGENEATFSDYVMLDDYKALERELAEALDQLCGIKEYREKNPLGGPAKAFDAMADQIRAGDDFNKVIADYGWCPVDRAERAESALADAERKIERLKFHAEAMAHYTDCYKDKWPDSGARQALEEYRAEFKE